MSEQIEREYDMDDLAMLERAQVFHDNFVADQATFVADFPYMATPFETDFQTAIDTADAIPSAQEVEGEISEVTFDLNEQLPLGRKALQKLYTYVDLVWPKGQKDSSFGRSKYEKARNSQVKMKELLEQGHRQADKASNKAALLAAGYTQAAIDELETIMTAIDTLNREQENLLSERGDKTYERISAYNAVWDYMKKINSASKVTFVDNPAKINQYLLYPTSSQSLPKPQNLQVAPDPQDPQNAVLTWNMVQGATSYHIYWSSVPLGQPSGTFNEVGQTNGETIFITPIGPGTENYWKIKAFGGGLSSAFSDEVNWAG